MWNWFNCYLSGRHEYGVWCEPGAIFLRCIHCGRRSSGWDIAARHAPHATATPIRTEQRSATAPRAIASTPRAVVDGPVPAPTRVLPFTRAATR